VDARASPLLRHTAASWFLARPSQLDPEITNFCPLEGENASRIKG